MRGQEALLVAGAAGVPQEPDVEGGYEFPGAGLCGLCPAFSVALVFLFWSSSVAVNSAPLFEALR